MKVLPLGAGQDIGKSCIIISISDKNIMLDCGIHIGQKDDKMYPNFTLLDEKKIDLVLLTHFHMDHCGALPYFTEKYGYTGPIYTTAPTKAILPMLLNDYSKIVQNKISSKYICTHKDIENSLSKISEIGMNTHLEVDGIEIRTFYAGHVLGAVMFYIKYMGESVLYTGDFNTTPDLHLSGAYVERVEPDLLITESTYGCKIQEGPKNTEREFLDSVYQCVEGGGSVLVPVFSIGRAQELSLIVDDFWNRLGLEIPVYCSSTLFQNANILYEKYISFTSKALQVKANTLKEENEYSKREYDKHRFNIKSLNESSNNKKVKDEPNDSLQETIEKNKVYCKKKLFEAEDKYFKYTQPNKSFIFKHVHQFKWEYLKSKRPMVVFSGPSMLHSGASLSIFKEWCEDSKNLVIIPGYCIKGTIGEKVVSGAKSLVIHKKEYKINIKVKNFPFSAHTDAMGIAKIIQAIAPKNILLVHGDKHGIKQLKSKIEKNMKIPVFTPKNCEEVEIKPRILETYTLKSDILKKAASIESGDVVEVKIVGDQIEDLNIK